MQLWLLVLQQEKAQRRTISVTKTIESKIFFHMIITNKLEC